MSIRIWRPLIPVRFNGLALEQAWGLYHYYEGGPDDPFPSQTEWRVVPNTCTTPECLKPEYWSQGVKEPY
jgi:rubredoxin